ncbi:hypothetical protein D3C81_1524050 [compost metagenome]
MHPFGVGAQRVRLRFADINDEVVAQINLPKLRQCGSFGYRCQPVRRQIQTMHIGKAGEKSRVDTCQIQATQGKRGHMIKTHRFWQFRQGAQARAFQRQCWMPFNIVHASLPGMTNPPCHTHPSEQLDRPGRLSPPQAQCLIQGTQLFTQAQVVVPRGQPKRAGVLREACHRT